MRLEMCVLKVVVGREEGCVSLAYLIGFIMRVAYRPFSWPRALSACSRWLSGVLSSLVPAVPAQLVASAASLAAFGELHNVELDGLSSAERCMSEWLKVKERREKAEKGRLHMLYNITDICNIMNIK